MKVEKTAVVSLNNDFRYFAEVIEYYGRYFYQVDNVAIEINKYEYDRMVAGHWHRLAYFHTVLKLHVAIQRKKEDSNLRIENTESKLSSNYETALGVAKSWIQFNKELCDAKGFVVSSYITNKSTGFSISSGVALENEALIKDLVDKMQVEEKLSLAGIFSGLVSNKTT
ncbi:hypothetical protein K8Q96_00135 [Candidatus Nomurabacteria bacterium]|nr:hypothetical protein [Candidatus Nomurabacteria bacterium]